jgi:hypothetical protein
MQNGASGAADWIDNSTIAYSYGTGATIFNASVMQTLNTPNSFGSLTVDNAGIDLGADATAVSWLLTKGIINTNSFEVIATSTVSTGLQPGPKNPGFLNSWVNGNVRRYITPATVDSYAFPIGNSTTNNMVTLTGLMASPLTGTTYLDVSFGAKPGNDVGLVVTENGTAYVSVNTAGVWHITPDAEPTAGQYNLQLNIGGFTGLLDNEFAILERPDASSNAADWMVPAGSILPAEGTPGRTVASGYAQRNGLSAFSQFGIGMTSIPLPIILLNFDAQRLSNNLVALQWETSQEENDKGFEVERKLDDEQVFGSVGFVPSAAPGGTSATTLQYAFTDTNSYSGISYYRLQQEDLGGNVSYSGIKAVSGSAGQLSVSLYPNPGHGQFIIRVDGSDQPWSALVTDELGHVIRLINATGNTPVTVAGLDPGLYFIHIPDVFGKGRSFTEKVLIIR